ncbi:hypothetical protein A5880_002497 [Enterococcus sp. 4G2_DIV0659]|uniref:Uncharacterized protein n=1 Tax=Candidatus Enterococcus mansonii TaxID=1834181 RepID=A0A242CII7_9ENTE|nr:hypothetical protein A5880_000400 [Enterococcus sp. 4G2_DIV0659]
MSKTKEEKVARNCKVGKTLAVVVGGLYLVKLLKGKKHLKK